MKPPLKNPASLLLLAAFSGAGEAVLFGPHPVLCGSAQAQSFNIIDFPGTRNSILRGLSADGSAAAGSFTPLGQSWSRAYRWSATAGFEALVDATAPQDHDNYGISGDGSATVGVAFYLGEFGHAYRYRGPGTYERLSENIPNHLGSSAFGSNHDGSVVVGGIGQRLSATETRTQAVRWNADGSVTQLGFTAYGSSYANAISRDGSTVVGNNDGFYQDAFRYTDAGGIQRLPNLLGNRSGSNVAIGVSGNGQFIVGNSNDRAVVWHDNTVTELRLSNGDRAYASPEAVSDDGSVLAGALFVDSDYVAGVWTAATQFIPLTDYLLSYGIQVPSNFITQEVVALSADGRTFAGNGYFQGRSDNVRGFVVTVPTPSSVLVVLIPFVLAPRRRRVIL